MGEPLCREGWQGGRLEVSRVPGAHQDDQGAFERQALVLVLTERLNSCGRGPASALGHLPRGLSSTTRMAAPVSTVRTPVAFAFQGPVPRVGRQADSAEKTLGLVARKLAQLRVCWAFR